MPLLVTAVAGAVNVAVVAPAATVADAATVTAVLLLESVTTAPPAGAAAVRVTVQLLVPGVAMVAGLHVRAFGRTGGCTVTTVVFDTLAARAVSVTFVLLATVPAVAVKPAEVAPAATVTDAGTVTAALSLDNVTTVPPAGAATQSVTVQPEVPPEATVEGVQLSVAGAATAAFNASVKVFAPAL